MYVKTSWCAPKVPANSINETWGNDLTCQIKMILWNHLDFDRKTILEERDSSAPLLHPLPRLAQGDHPMSHYTVLTMFINPARYMLVEDWFLMPNLAMDSLYNGLAYCAMYSL